MKIGVPVMDASGVALAPQKTWFTMKKTDEEMEISIHDEIGFWGITAKNFIKALNDSPKAKKIHLRINSPGGEVFEGNAIYNELISYGASIRVTIDSLAASMASVLAMTADPGKISMPENAMYMIHNPLMMIGGDAETLRKYADVLDNLKEGILSAYMRHSTKTRAQMSKIMDEETWLSAAEAKDIGFASEVIESKDSAKNEANRERVAICKTRVMALATFPKAKSTEGDNPQPTTRKGDPMDLYLDKNGNLVDRATGQIVKTKEKLVAEGENIALLTVDAREKEMFEARQSAAAAENKRISDIRAMCAGVPGCDEAFIAGLTKPEVTVQAAQSAVMAKLKEGLAHIETIAGGDESDKTRAGLTNMILVKSGIERDPKKIAELHQSELAPVAGLQGLIRFCAAKAGLKQGAFAGNADMGRIFLALLGYDVPGIPRAAMGMNTNDLNSVLSTTANAAMLKGYGDEATTYQRVSRNVSLTDLKQADLYKTSGSPDVLVIPEGQPPKLGVVSDKVEHGQLRKWGRAFSYPEEMAINDRFDLLTTLPYQWGRAIPREQNNRFWNLLLTGNGPNLGETGAALFQAAGAAANQAAAGGAISQTTLSAGFVAMRRYARLNPDGGQSRTTRLNMPPRIIATGSRSEWLVRQFTSNVYVPQTTPPANTNMNADNLFRQGASMGLEPVIESLIDDLVAGTNAWLLLQDPNIIDYSLTLSLQGRETPQTMSRMGGAGEVKGLIFDIEHFFEVAFVDWRGFWKNVGV